MNWDLFEDTTWVWLVIVLGFVVLALLGQQHVQPANLLDPDFWGQSLARAVGNLILSSVTR